MIDPRTPVIVGVDQTTVRPGGDEALAAAREPVDLMADASRGAARDSGARSDLLSKLDAVWVPQPLSRRYPDPGRLLLARLGVDAARTYRARVGGNSPQLMMSEACASIQRGDSDVCLLAGAEAMYSRLRARARGIETAWERSDIPECAGEVGDDRPGTSETESEHGAALPVLVYPLFETALRAARHRTVAEHEATIGALWSRFSAVAAENPHAWTRTAYDASEIVTPSAENRVVALPYTKRMCANLMVDQAAAIIVTSYGTAAAAGVPDERLVFPLAGADAHDHFFFTERWSLADSPAIRIAGGDAVAAGGTTIDDVTRFDIYSCFPSAVQVATDSLGLRDQDNRALTLTGGLAFFGGPGNNYVTHSIAATVEACRRDPGSIGMVTGVGWYLTKHSVGLYSTSPPQNGFMRVDPAGTQAKVDALDGREPLTSFEGEATVEATAIPYARDGSPESAILSVLTDDGRRALATTDDADTLGSMSSEAWEGRRVKLRRGETRNLLA